MKNISVNIKREIEYLEIVNADFINKQGNAVSITGEHETIERNLFVELFANVDLKELFAQRIFSRN
ncbi:hypothetical protein OU798_14915 [Prolixibacteraceae bacterium Z1-6]|uniref:Uncharacterized protein n=1 Tax=Draconibacterium aestuarii TaxID=2998507 RepID=A0A9X3F6U2_9BACT|nr:hypothetical protein [Prolixibacteraceae bacterium Z1-6]